MKCRCVTFFLLGLISLPVFHTVRAQDVSVYGVVDSLVQGADGDGDGYYETFDFLIRINGDVTQGSATVYAKMICTTTGQAWWSPAPWTITGMASDYHYFGPFDQTYFPNISGNNDLDFTVELWDQSKTRKLATVQDLPGEPVKADVQHGRDTTTQHRRILMVCCDFRSDDGNIEGSDYARNDRNVIIEFLAHVGCWRDCVDLVLVPESQGSCTIAERAAQQMGARSVCLNDEERENYGLQQQPSLCVREPDGRPVAIPAETRGLLRRLPPRVFRPAGLLALIVDTTDEVASEISLEHDDCAEIAYHLNAATFLDSVPAGKYHVQDGARLIRTIDVSEGMRNDRRISREDLRGPAEPPPPRPKKPSRYRTFGPGFVGFAFGMQLIPLQDNDYEYWRGLVSVGLSGRYFGVLGVEAMAFLADSLKSLEGGRGGIEICPSFLCISNAISLTAKGGVLWLKPRMIGPASLRKQIDYRVPYAGAGLFVGAVGRNRNKRGPRVGIIADAIYSEPESFVTYEAGLPLGFHSLRLGGWSGGLYFQAEF